MAYRTFLDNNGRYWQVWESHPQRFERRRSERRQSDHPWRGEERRGTERRQNVRNRAVVVDTQLANGWLTFESFTEKRRLAPVPHRWEEMSVRDLIDLWERANPVSRIVDESTAA